MSKIDLIGKLAVVQGKTFEKIKCFFPGDVSLWTPRAQIRSKWYYKEVAGATAIKAFSFYPLTYNAVEDKTLVFPTISAADTATIAPTKYQGDGRPSQGIAYVWDLELEEPGTGRIIGLDWGWVQVRPEVTA